MIGNQRNGWFRSELLFAITLRVVAEDQFADHGNLRSVSRSRKGTAQDEIRTDP
jgi:hypothetical protein